MSHLSSAISHKLSAIPLGLQQGAIMFVASSLSNAMNYLLHVFMSRMLGPAEYGVFTSLLGLYLIVATPEGILPTVTAKYVSQFHALGETHRVGGLLTDVLKWVTLAGTLAAALIALASPYLASYLQIPSPVPVLVVATMLLIGALQPIATGALQGLQKFWALGGIGLLGTGSRLLFGVGLVYLGLGASGALAASTLSGIVVFAVALIPLAYLFRQGSKGAAVETGHGLTARDVLSYSGLVLVGLACFTALTNVDLVMVKHYFSPTEAGYYSAASVLAKIILFFPGAVACVMFPKTSERHALNQDPAGIARTALLAVAVLSCGLLLAYFLFPSLLVKVLFGPGYEATIRLVGIFGVPMALYALVNLLLSYYLSIRNARFIWLLVGSTALQVVLLSLFHTTLLQVITVLLLNAFLLLVLSEVFCRGLTKSPPRPGLKPSG
jgi:O-antigen/teichoic acid export membrane protein